MPYRQAKHKAIFSAASEPDKAKAFIEARIGLSGIDTGVFCVEYTGFTLGFGFRGLGLTAFKGW